MTDFFISYNRNDRRWAEWIAWTLEEAGYTVMIQAWDFKPGQDFLNLMKEAAGKSNMLLAVISQDYFDAHYTNVEWNAFFIKGVKSGERRILPVRVRECQPPDIFASLIYVDLVGLTEEEARAFILNAADDSRMRPSAAPGFPGGAQPPAVERNTLDTKPYPGEAGGPAAANPGLEAAPNLGPVVSKSCDRDEQQEAFDTTFREGVKRHHGCPQMYIVHGPTRERHASLVQRWRDTLIQSYADHLSGQSKSAVIFWEHDRWPATGKVETDLDRLIEWLLIQCDSKNRFEPREYTPRAFRELVLPLRKQVIVVQHEINAARPLPDTPRLIGEYLKFWEQVKGDADIPQFLIFLNVEYLPGRIENFWRPWEVVWRLRRAHSNRKIVSALTSIGGASRRTAGDCADTYCFYTPLKELPCVRLDDVVAWFKKHRLGRNEVAWETQGRNIFRLRGWKFHESKNMADVEDALDDFIAAM